jgi:hypothetical protein
VSYIGGPIVVPNPAHEPSRNRTILAIKEKTHGSALPAAGGSAVVETLKAMAVVAKMGATNIAPNGPKNRHPLSQVSIVWNGRLFDFNVTEGER